MSIKVAFTIPLSAKAVFKVIKDLELLFKLNIQWHLKKHNFAGPIQKGSKYQLLLHDEKRERDISCSLEVIDFVEDNLLIFELKENDIPLRRFIFKVKEIEGDKGLIEVEELRESPFSEQDRLELNLWVKSIINYAMVSQSQRILLKIWKFFLDKVYLKLSPTGRRIVFLVIISEIFALFFFILLVLYFYFLK